MADPITWFALATVVGEAAIVIVVLLLWNRLGEWTHELRAERRAADRVTRSNQNVIDWLVRTTGIEPDPTIFDDQERSA